MSVEMEGASSTCDGNHLRRCWWEETAWRNHVGNVDQCLLWTRTVCLRIQTLIHTPTDAYFSRTIKESARVSEKNGDHKIYLFIRSVPLRQRKVILSIIPNWLESQTQKSRKFSQLSQNILQKNPTSIIWIWDITLWKNVSRKILRHLSLHQHNLSFPNMF